MPPALSDEEFHQITELVQPVPYARRADFIREVMTEIVAAGVRSAGVVKKIGQRLQARFLGAAPIIGIEDRD